ncbi:MAG TPA: acetyl-CoA carboxylase biotin carboxyl carrier protein subunit [Desulfobacterales bacterium]|nr:acetyl-CoA carboxylase biotin carboxyl carrier protein subunit [Desulfobacterales bacterium]
MGVEVMAPISGKILEVYVQVGDQVNEDDELLNIEAMKMGNPIYADSPGIVKEIKVKQDDEVKEDAVLLILE